MENRIVSIVEKVPQIAVLPDGYYTGIWGGYIIELSYKDKRYELRTENGVRGVGIKVVVQIKDGVATFEELKS